MAQTQHRETSSDARRANVPATSAAREQLGSRDLQTWASSSPFGLMRRLSEDMDQFFGQLAGGSLMPSGGSLAGGPVQWVPAIELVERDGNLVVQAELPGLAVSDVLVEADDEVLTISGERRDEREIEGDGVRRTERLYGRFSRSIPLPEGAKADEIHAAFRDGILEITVPLSQGSSQRRRVDVQGSAQSSSQQDGPADSSSSAQGGSSQQGQGGSTASSGNTGGAR